MTAAIIFWVTVNLSAAQVDTVETHAQAEQLRIPPPPPALPEEIRAFLLDPPTTEVALAVPSNEFEFHARTNWKKLSPGDARSLGEILLAQEEHHPGGTKACIFQTTLAYRMKRANGFLTIQVSHHCAQAYLDSPHERAGLALDRVNSDLITLAKKYFPKDQVLADLPDRSPEGSSEPSGRTFPLTPFGHRFVAGPSTGLRFRVVQFDQDGIHWNESDLLGLFERVTMDSLGNLTGRGGVRGRYDSKTGVLIWNGYPYDLEIDPKK